MKAKQVTVTVEGMLGQLNDLKSRNQFDADQIKMIIGESGAPHRNHIRPVGNFESVRTHYLGGLLTKESIRDNGLSYVTVCVGTPNCPICEVAGKLADGTEHMKTEARKYFSSESNLWNVLPRWKYDYGDEGERFLYMRFGANARKTLERIVEDYGHPGAIQDGFDLLYITEKAAAGKKSNYEFVAVLEKTKRDGRISQDLVYTPLTAEEGEMDLVDLEEHTKPPDAETMDKLSELFNADELLGTGKSTRRADVSGGDSDKEPEIGAEAEEQGVDDDKPICFGDPDVLDENHPECRDDCSFFEDCKVKVKGGQSEGDE